MTPIMWWGLIANDFLAKPAKLASRWHHNFSLVPELQMLLLISAEALAKNEDRGSFLAQDEQHFSSMTVSSRLGCCVGMLSWEVLWL